MTDSLLVSEQERPDQIAPLRLVRRVGRDHDYLIRPGIVDGLCALAAIWIALDVRFGGRGVGSDELRRVLNAGIFLTASVALVAYATKTDVARVYFVMSLSCLTIFCLFTRFRLRSGYTCVARGSCMRPVVVVGNVSVAGS